MERKELMSRFEVDENTGNEVGCDKMGLTRVLGAVGDDAAIDAVL